MLEGDAPPSPHADPARLRARRERAAMTTPGAPPDRPAPRPPDHELRGDMMQKPLFGPKPQPAAVPGTNVTVDGEVVRVTYENDETCSPLISTSTWTATPDGGACDDGNSCTAGEYCSGGVCAQGAVQPKGTPCADTPAFPGWYPGVCNGGACYFGCFDGQNFWPPNTDFSLPIASTATRCSRPGSTPWGATATVCRGRARRASATWCPPRCARGPAATARSRAAGATLATASP